MANYDNIEVIDGKEIPFKVYVERRKSVRVSFGRSCINLRMPSSLSKRAQDDHYASAVKWVRDSARKNQGLLDNYICKNYDKIEFIEIYGKKLALYFLGYE